jgi:GGDEF domain-containing protein
LWRYCRQKRVPATLVLLDVPDLQKIREVYHAGATAMVELRVLEAVAALDVGKHVLARLSMWRFALLMAGTTREQALKLVEASLGRPPVIEMDDGQLNVNFMVQVHALESQRQDTTLVDFYKAALAALDAQAGQARAGDPRPAAAQASS